MISQRGVANLPFTRHELIEMERRCGALRRNGVDCEPLTPSETRRWLPNSAREFNRAHILAALDRGLSEAQIMEVLGVGERPSGASARRIWKAGWNMPCTTWRGRANRGNTILTSKRRLRPWPVSASYARKLCMT